MNVIDDVALQTAIQSVESQTVKDLCTQVVPVIAATLDAQRTALFSDLDSFVDRTIEKFKGIKAEIV